MIDCMEQVAKFLLEQSELLLICHKSPDGDTVGSAFALYYGLTALGKKVNVLCQEDWPESFSYLYPDSAFREREGTPVTVDIASPQLMGAKLEEYANTIALCIDHHGCNSVKATRFLLDEWAAATAEIVFFLLQRMNVSLSQQIANCLYTGICTDTGCFRYSNCTSQTHRIAATLIECGAQASEINRRLFEMKSLGRLRLEQKVLEKLSLFHDGQIAFSELTRSEFLEAGAIPSDFDGIPAILRSIQGVQIAIMVKEQQEGSYKVSVRTSEEVDASAFCRQFGGGGHIRASGCTISGTAQEVKRQLCEAADRWLTL